MRRLTSVALFFALAVHMPGAQSEVVASEPVDLKLTRSVDTTGDGKEDLVVLHVKGASVRAPFKWTLSIYSEGKRVFQVERNDAPLDRYFEDENYRDGCHGYLECKKKYYFKDILEGIVKAGEWTGGEKIYDRAYDGSIWRVAGEHLKQNHKLSSAQALEVVNALVGRLQQKQATILIVPISPVQMGYPMVFVEQVQSFVPVYQW